MILIIFIKDISKYSIDTSCWMVLERYKGVLHNGLWSKYTVDKLYNHSFRFLYTVLLYERDQWGIEYHHKIWFDSETTT